MWFLFSIIEMSQVNYIKKKEEKRVLCTASAAEAVLSHAVCGPHPGSLVTANKGGVSSFLLQD